ncbi:MAG: hypothetical protein Q8R28_01750 [Dehalococcoidia bacterium]|nr:hypothetical protein [Dehalococcoidia bacterium]
MDARGRITILADPSDKRSGNELRTYMVGLCLAEGRSNVFHWAMSVVTDALSPLAGVAHYSTLFSCVFGVEFTGDLIEVQWGQPRADGAMEARYRHREGNQESQGQEAQGARKQRPKTPARREVSYQRREASSAIDAWGRLDPLCRILHLRFVRLVSSPIVSL